MKNKTQIGPGHIASARGTDLNISTRQSVEISNALRYLTTVQAKKYLEEVISLKRAVPFKRFLRDMGHKPGMSAGRYPQKAAKAFLMVVKSVEANAQVKGLNTSNLKITKMIANKAAVPLTGGRNRQGTKRTHLEIEVQEKKAKKETRKGVASKVTKQDLKKDAHKKVKKESKAAAKSHTDLKSNPEAKPDPKTEANLESTESKNKSKEESDTKKNETEDKK
jgi:large subunit ribosomal protein L22